MNTHEPRGLEDGVICAYSVRPGANPLSGSADFFTDAKRAMPVRQDWQDEEES